MIISIDAGKGFTKYAYENDKGNFELGNFDTKYSNVSESGGTNISGAKAFKVEYDGNHYDVGIHGKTDMRLKGTTKQQYGHRLAALVAITRCLPNTTGESVDLVLSIPAQSYKLTEEAEEYKQFFLGDDADNVEITVNGIDYSFKINDILIMPEGLGYMFANEVSDKRAQLIVDIGHLNTQFLTIIDGDIVDMNTSEEGGFEFERMAKSEYGSRMDGTLSSRYFYKNMIEGYVPKDDGTPVDGSDTVIKDIKNQYLDKLVDEIKSLRIEIANQDEIIFIGGTSILLKDVILEHQVFKDRSVISETGKYDTVKGNLVTGLVYFEKEDVKEGEETLSNNNIGDR